MYRQDFRAMANILRAARDNARDIDDTRRRAGALLLWLDIQDDIARYCASKNPGFNRETFNIACGLDHE